MTPAVALRSLGRVDWWRGARPRRAGPRARARSAVLSGLLLAAAAHAALALAVETRRPEWRDPEYFHRLKRLVKVVRWDHEQGHARPLVVVLGGSRPQMGLSPAHLGFGDGPTAPRVFSLTKSGTLPAGVRVNAGRLFDTGLRPDFVLVEVLPPVLADAGGVEAYVPGPALGAADLARALPYHPDSGRAARSWVRGRVGSWSTLRVPLLANWGLADTFPPGPHRSDFLWRDMRFEGWSPYYPGTWVEGDWTPRLAAAQAAYTARGAGGPIQPAAEQALRDTLAACRDHGAKAALYVMPESAGFRAAYPPTAGPTLAALLADLGRDFGVPVFDASRWEYPEDAYMDGHHLLGPAAEAFSRRFGRECVGPWIGLAPRGGD